MGLSPGVRWARILSGIGERCNSRIRRPALLRRDQQFPWGRPKLEEVRGGVDFVVENDYPARGAA